MARKEDRAEFEARALKLIEQYGDQFDRAGLVGEFKSRGIGQSTLYRWLDALEKSGRAGAHLGKVVQREAEARAQRTADPAADAAREAVEVLPPVPDVSTLVETGGVVSVVDKLRTCIAIAEELMNHARTEEGKPRNVKLLLAASEHLRRSAQTVVQLQEAMLAVVHVERFHEAIFQVLREEDPALVERILMKFRQVNAQFGM